MTFIAIRSPSTSVRFCAGAMNSSLACIAASISPARITPSIAWIEVSAGDSAVQASEATWPGGVTEPRS